MTSKQRPRRNRDWPAQPPRPVQRLAVSDEETEGARRLSLGNYRKVPVRYEGTDLDDEGADV